MKFPPQAYRSLVTAMQRTPVPPIAFENFYFQARGRTSPRDGCGGDLLDLRRGGFGTRRFRGDIDGHAQEGRSLRLDVRSASPRVSGRN
jgi:hypothetical protein